MESALNKAKAFAPYQPAKALGMHPAAGSKNTRKESGMAQGRRYRSSTFAASQRAGTAAAFAQKGYPTALPETEQGKSSCLNFRRLAQPG